MKPLGKCAEYMSTTPVIRHIGQTCYARFAWIIHLFKTHPRFQDRVNKLIAYHEEHFKTPLPDDLYAEIKQMNTSDYPGERVLRKSMRPILALIHDINNMKEMAKQTYPSL